MTKHKIFIGQDGLLKFIYDDDLLPLLQLGTASVTRASHVEPSRNTWSADLSPSGGPVLGPFARRADALQAEVTWLHDQFQGNTRQGNTIQ